MEFALSKEEMLELWNGTEAQERRAVQAKRLDYYEGRQAILKRSGLRRDGKPYHKIVMNWIKILVDRQVGFNLGKPVNVTLPQEADRGGLAGYREVRVANALDTLDAQMFRDCLLFGSGVEVHAFDGERAVVRGYLPLEWHFVRDSQQGIVAAVHRCELSAGSFWRGELLREARVAWRLYDARCIREFEGDGVDIREVGEARPHFYGRIPVARMRLNREEQPYVTDGLVSLQDAYNTALSSHCDDHEADVYSILALYGVSPDQFTRRDPESGKTYYETIRERGAIAFPDKDSGAEFLSRKLPVEKTEFTLRSLRRLIHDAGSAPDLLEMVGATGSTSGIALKLRFQAMAEVASEYAKHIQAFVHERIGLLNAIWKRTGRSQLLDCDVTTSLSIPANEVEIWGHIGDLKDILSRVDRARLVPSVEDPVRAVEAKEEEIRKDLALQAEPAPREGNAPSDAGV